MKKFVLNLPLGLGLLLFSITIMADRIGDLSGIPHSILITTVLALEIRRIILLSRSPSPLSSGTGSSGSGSCA